MLAAVRRRNRCIDGGIRNGGDYYTIQTLCEAGDNIVSVSTLYGGTTTYLLSALPRQGIEVRFFDYTKPETG